MDDIAKNKSCEVMLFLSTFEIFPRELLMIIGLNIYFLTNQVCYANVSNKTLTICRNVPNLESYVIDGLKEFNQNVFAFEPTESKIYYSIDTKIEIAYYQNNYHRSALAAYINEICSNPSYSEI